MNPPSGNVLAPGGKIVQVVKVMNTSLGEKPIMLKVKVDYVLNGNPVSDIEDVNVPEYL